jgi:hypothetical protein
MTAVLAIGAVQDHAANRGVELTPAVPPRFRERLEPAHRARTDCNPDRSLSDYPHMRANLTLLQLRRPAIPVAVPTRKGGKMPPPMARYY